jgi:flagellar protein FlaG
MSIESIGTNNAPSQQVVSSRQLPEANNAATAEQVKPLTNSTQSVQQNAPAEKVEVSAERLQDAVEKMNELMQSGNRSLRFQVDDTTERVVVKVLDIETDEVIRQIPSEETLKFSEFLEGMVGLIFDKKA